MINSDKKKVTVDFHWTTESEDGTTGYGVFVKHHYTEEYGPTISVSETEGDYISFPSKMFAEVVDFLRREGHIEPSETFKAAAEASAKRTLEMGKVGYAVPKTVLAPPIIENSTQQQEQVEQQEEPPEIIIDSSNPIGSFDGEETPYLSPGTFQTTPESPQTNKTSNGLSSQDMALERQQAVDKQQSGAKTIKSIHKEETEE
jgi:hypothetical protein